MTRTALHSLFGAVGGVEREQEVWTPAWILDAVARSFGGRIWLDPCAASRAEGQFAAHSITLPADGLAVPWDPEGTFLNPPFKTLEPWLAKAHAAHGKRIGLFPCRPHRRWWYASLRGAEVVFLHYDVKFEGHRSAFPAPLVLAAWGCSIIDLGSRETHRMRIP